MLRTATTCLFLACLTTGAALAQNPVPGFANPNCEADQGAPPDPWTNLNAAGSYGCPNSAAIFESGCGVPPRNGVSAFLPSLLRDADELGQVIDLTSFGANVEGKQFALEAYARECVAETTDEGAIRLTFFDASDVQVGSTASTAVSPTFAAGWVLYSVNANAPAGARKVRVEIACDNNDASYCDIAYDDLTLETSTALPVELVAFDAVVKGAETTLRWATASETNNAGFEVEQRRADTWERIGFVAGWGTTAEPQQYAYRIAALEPGLHRFRLRQVDYDGAFAYSPEVEVTIGVPGTHFLSGAYPNPFNPQTTFNLAVQAAQHVRVAVHDLLGRQVALLHDGELAAGAAHRFAFEGADLPSGTYLLQVHAETFEEARTLVLAK